MLVEKVFYIRGNVPSSKNGKIKTQWGITVSKAVKKWKKDSKSDWVRQKDEFVAFTNGIKWPMFIHLVFIKNTEVLFDYMGPGETIMDEMIIQEWINDDNVYQIVPVFGRFRVDRENAGVEIRLLSNKPKYEFL